VSAEVRAGTPILLALCRDVLLAQGATYRIPKLWWYLPRLEREQSHTLH